MEVVMKSEITKVFGIAAMASVLAVACTTVEAPEDDPGTIAQESTVSVCGGFDPKVVEYPEDSGDQLGYCDAEVLEWQYEAETQTLVLVNTRIELNCCGNHGSTIAKQGDVYVVTQVDAPEGMGGRCDCMCVFDYELMAEGIEGDAIDIQVMRDVTDSQAGPQLVFEGTIDLTQGVGEAILDAEPSDWCYDDEAPSAS
jgi:hypothetical protein